MSFFISEALAADAPAKVGAAAQTPGLASFVPLVIIFVVFYFLLIRPQSKRAKEHRNMVSALQKGDEIVTNGGVLGRITATDEAFITIEIAENVEVRVQRHAVAALMPKGTYK
jgi:preprotein translocase subunit YajC